MGAFPLIVVASKGFAQHSAVFASGWSTKVLAVGALYDVCSVLRVVAFFRMAQGCLFSELWLMGFVFFFVAEIKAPPAAVARAACCLGPFPAPSWSMRSPYLFEGDACGSCIPVFVGKRMFTI